MALPHAEAKRYLASWRDIYRQIRAAWEADLQARIDEEGCGAFYGAIYEFRETDSPEGEN